jgi:hypothetical protein
MKHIGYLWEQDNQFQNFGQILHHNTFTLSSVTCKKWNTLFLSNRTKMTTLSFTAVDTNQKNTEKTTKIITNSFALKFNTQICDARV